jgi:catechol 2,3-dioxygenase-like lactoylglutathione lyase family enzyme
LTTSAISIQKITQISIPVTDVKKSVDFYEKTLGLPVLYSEANMALLECSGIRLLLSLPETPMFDHPSSTVYFQVEDLEGSYQKMTSNGVDFMSKPHKIAEFNGYAVWMAFFYDPDRNIHALTSEIALS